MKIEWTRPSDTTVTHRGYNIPVGTVFTGDLQWGSEGPYLRACDRIVDLSSPRTTWQCTSPADSPKVYGYVELNAKVVVE